MSKHACSVDCMVDVINLRDQIAEVIIAYGLPYYIFNDRYSICHSMLKSSIIYICARGVCSTEIVLAVIICWQRVLIKILKILQELAESKTKAYLKHQRERWTNIS